ncbi:MAG: hydantoinase/oxoprolinase family protein [Rhodobacteraceae bacterium]|nr:hydantoinase/oxoprolinase family protein [Paracoccaceae bacterium]
MREDPIRAGVDIGGTFTDVALEHAGGLSTCKLLTDHGAPERAIMAGLERAAARAGVAPGDIGQVIHGTTLVTNALIERRGARVAFITTDGFRDVIEMRTESRFEQYDLNLVLPAPLVARADRLVLAERVAADGSVLLAPDADAIAALAETVAAGGYEAVAVGFLHAYANDAHERAMAEALNRAAPGLPVSLSSAISPRMREFERFNTVIANAYVQPLMADYLRRLVERLRAAGIGAPVFMMHSGGGLIGLETAVQQPVRLLESGPAGGAIYAAGFARAHGQARTLSFDMGGTTAKICLIEDGTPRTAASFEVARTWRFRKGSGMAVSTPVVEMVEIGAGGGSIAWVDGMGRIRVGPRSAGSEPGPACYGRGGDEPTVTDANLVLGRIDADNFAGGAIALSRERAGAALAARLGGVAPDAQAAAFAVTEMVDENMANAARVHAVENGRDIESYTMIAFGGGAPLHACRQCEKLGIAAALIPPGAGVGSAIGFLRAPFSYEATRGLFQRLSEFDAGAVNAALAVLEAEARAFLARGAGQGAATATRLIAHMRYGGQGWEIPVVLEHRRFAESDRAAIRAAFEAAYRQLFGRIIEGLEIEIANWALRVATALPPVQEARRFLAAGAEAAGRPREFYDAALRATVAAREVARADMAPGVGVDGPAVIVEDETATIVTSAFRAIGQGDGSLLLLRKEAGA